MEREQSITQIILVEREQFIIQIILQGSNEDHKNFMSLTCSGVHHHEVRGQLEFILLLLKLKTSSKASGVSDLYTHQRTETLSV